MERSSGRGRRSPPSSPTRRVRSTTAGRCIHLTWRRTTTRRRGSGPCISVVPGSWPRSTALRGGVSSSSDGTTCRIWSVRSRPRPTFLTTTPSAASGRARREFDSCCRGSRRRRRNLERLSELIAANERDERCELMLGSPGTILAGRELGLDVAASIEWLRGQRDTDGLWTQHLFGQRGRVTSVRRTGSRAVRWRSATSPTSRRRSGALPSRRTGSSTGRRYAGMAPRRRTTATARSARSGATARRGSLRRSRPSSTTSSRSRAAS